MFRLRFSLRSLGLTMSLIAIGLATIPRYVGYGRLRSVVARAKHVNPPLAKDARLAFMLDDSYTRIRHASFHGRGRVNDADMVQIAKLSGLRRLSLYGAAITDESAAELARLTHLETLSLENTSITDTTLRAIAKLPKLKSLNLNQTGVTDQGIEYLVGLPQLMELKAERVAFTGAGVAQLSQSKTLRAIQISSSTGFTLQSSRSLRSVRVYVGRLDQLLSIEDMPVLEHLTIEVDRVNGPELAAIHIASAPQLQDVMILGAGAELVATPSVRSLFVFGNGSCYGSALPQLRLQTDLPRLIKFRADNVTLTPETQHIVSAALQQ